LALRQEELTSLSDDVDLERDRALVERCQSGDPSAFGNLYARYNERLIRFCLRRLNDRHEAEDAAQEAFARAWKALPHFAGERRFYPWLTVIAGNVCTDVVRRRSRSTPTPDLELTAQQPEGVVSADSSEELVLAAVDGELVKRALDRLSPRHRHVLAMREGSGWTYQQIADHEGVEIGTIETLLWRARQALKREFAAVSGWKEALAGFLVAGAALFRRIIMRIAHRGASMHSQSGNSGVLRSAVAGAAVAGAAVAAALITPHTLSSSSGTSQPVPLAGSAGAAAANPALPITMPSPTSDATGISGARTTSGASSGGSIASAGKGSGGGGTSSSPLLGESGAAGVGGGLTGGVSGTTGGLRNGLGNPVGGLSGAVHGVTGGLGNAVSGLGNTVGGVTGGVGGAVSGLGNTINGVTGGVGGAVGGIANNPTQGVSGAVSGLSGAVSGLLGGVTGAGGPINTPTSSGTGSGGSSTGSTTQTTNPGTLGGLTQSVGNPLNGLLGG
jgi:RNA polymerase sigma-70 factor (ECF subfamily)